MIFASLLLLSTLSVLMTFIMGRLVLDTFRAIRKMAAVRGQRFGALRDPMPVSVPSRPTLG
jgi:hypothetical protein